MKKNDFNYLPHEQFIRSLQSQIALGAKQIQAYEDDVAFLKDVRLAELLRYGKKTYAWVQTSDQIDTLKKTIKKLANFQSANKQLLKYLVARQREIIDLHKSEEQIVWEVTL